MSRGRVTFGNTLCGGCWRSLEKPHVVHGYVPASPRGSKSIDRQCVEAYVYVTPLPRRLRWRCQCCRLWFCWCNGAGDEDAFGEVCDACWGCWTDGGAIDTIDG